MKVNLIMPDNLRHFYNNELGASVANWQKRQPALAFRHLERAHILGQAFPFQHTFVHWEMLKFGFRIKSWKEIAGQIPRLLVGGVKSFVGKIPVGNTGGANVSPLQQMEIPFDLKEILENNSVLN
jgi:hypothetical protein